QPTVVILGYGMASSLEEMDALNPQAGPLRFKSDMEKLMDAIKGLSTNKPVRFILLGPIRHESLGPPLPYPARHNKRLAGYVKVLQGIARERKCPFISLFDLIGPGRPLTDYGI